MRLKRKWSASKNCFLKSKNKTSLSKTSEKSKITMYLIILEGMTGYDDNELYFTYRIMSKEPAIIIAQILRII